MEIKDARLVAAAIVIVGAAWLYFSEVRPRQLEKECTVGVLRPGVSTDMINEAIRLCIKAGGLAEARRAYQDNAPTRTKADSTAIATDPASAADDEAEVASRAAEAAAEDAARAASEAAGLTN